MSPTRADRERGAALVEFALVLVILLLLVFGIVDFGFAFNNYQNVRSGSREAARLGVVNDLSNAPACRINGVTVTPPAQPGNTSDATNALVCKAKDRIGLDEDQTKVKVSITGQSVGDSLNICASFPVKAVSGLTLPFISGKILKSSVTMRLEQVPQFVNYTEPGVSC